jgi:glycerol-3-phosphate acyltransferase PlsY
MPPLLQSLLWTAVAFTSGAIPFSLLIGRAALGTDVRQFGDGNPGATNVLRAGSKVWAAVAAMLDILKAALPVALTYVIQDMRGLEVVPVALAPVIGHLYSPFLRGRGGKGVAVTGGIWIGLTYGGATAVAAATLTAGYLVQSNPGWAVVTGLAGIGGYLLLFQPDPVLLIIWTGNALLLLWRHRDDLRQPPAWRHTRS